MEEENILEKYIDIKEHICPACGVKAEYRCRLCGATKSINQASGNVIWMRNGRVLAAFTDSLQAWARMAEEYNIPEEEWPEQFRGKKIFIDEFGE